MTANKKGKWSVRTRDVDGGTSRKYATLSKAVQRFESMSGWTMANALSEQFYRLTEQYKPIPTIEQAKFCRAVSKYGCVVDIHYEQSYDEYLEERAD